jgi:outer membrane protein OmpA-like peptidoglycan-associated protein
MPAFVYYRMIHAGHMELQMDEVRLDSEGSRCFQAHRRLFGAVTFDKAQDAVDETAFAAEAERLVKVWKDGAKKGAKPPVFLHAHADRDEVDSEQAARALSEKRAQTVQAWLVNRGVPKELVQIQAHGWDLSPAPLEPAEVLVPNRRVEISHDATAPSGAKVMRTQAVDEALLGSLQQRIRGLEGKTSPPADSQHAPRVLLVVQDGAGRAELSYDVASSGPEAVGLHRYFLSGLSSGCEFGPLP